MAAFTIINTSVFLICLYVSSTVLVPLLGREFLSRCVGYVLSVALSYLISSRFHGGKLAGVGGKAVLVTGCDTGIGNELARRLDALGFTVFAGCLFADGEEAMRLKRESSKRLEVVQLDVTSDRQVSDAVSEIERALSTSGDVLWGVVNNAGISYWGEVEWMSVERYKQVAEVNLWGMIRVTKAALPLIRTCKGRVVNMSSMLGHISSPFCSAYSITKYGVQALTDSLRVEAGKFGVSAIIVEPGNFSGGGSAMFTRDYMAKGMERVWSETPEHVRRVYGREYFESLRDLVVNTTQGTSNTSLSPVVEACTSALTDRYPQARYFPGNLTSRLAVYVSVFLPSALLDIFYAVFIALSTTKIKGSG